VWNHRNQSQAPPPAIIYFSDSNPGYSSFPFGPSSIRHLILQPTPRITLYVVNPFNVHWLLQLLCGLHCCGTDLRWSLPKILAGIFARQFSVVAHMHQVPVEGSWDHDPSPKGHSKDEKVQRKQGKIQLLWLIGLRIPRAACTLNNSKCFSKKCKWLNLLMVPIWAGIGIFGFELTNNLIFACEITVNTKYPFWGMLYLFRVWTKKVVVRILVIFQHRPMFSHINGKLSSRPFEWYGWT